MQHRTSCLCITPCQCASALAQGDPSPRVRTQINSASAFRASLSADTPCFYQQCWCGGFYHMDLGNSNYAYQLRHSFTSISTETLLSAANIQSWFVVFFLSTWILHPFFHPPGCSYPGHTRGTHTQDRHRERR